VSRHNGYGYRLIAGFTMAHIDDNPRHNKARHAKYKIDTTRPDIPKWYSIKGRWQYEAEPLFELYDND